MCYTKYCQGFHQSHGYKSSMSITIELCLYNHIKLKMNKTMNLSLLLQQELLESSPYQYQRKQFCEKFKVRLIFLQVFSRYYFYFIS